MFGDKAQVKGLKVSPHLKVDFVPVEYPEPRRIRASFKKLMQVCLHTVLLMVENIAILYCNGRFPTTGNKTKPMSSSETF